MCNGNATGGGSSNRLLSRDRFSRISEWRKIKREKQEKEESIKKEKEEREKEIETRKILRKIQAKKMLETESKIKIEAKRLKLQHEAKKKLIEKKLIDSETQLFSSSTPVEVDEDPLDAFMRNLAPPATAETKPKNRAKTKLSEKLSKAVEKAAPRHAIRIKSNEILDNESLYESKDLVIKEETSWLDKMRAKKREIKPVDHAATAYASFQRNFYIESPEIAVMTESEVDEYRKEYLEGVKIRGRFCPRPIKKWSQCGLPDKIYEVLTKHQYSEPFPIQCQAIPCIMSGLDVIACAKTGSGKTLAFVLPMFRHIADQRPLEPEEGPVALIISPTRELARQIYIETMKFAAPMGMRAVCCHGGATVADQIADLRRGSEIIVATPGRMIDMLCVNGGRVTNCRRVTYLVMDEADRMFDMGFEPQITTILNTIRPDRQTILFSATFPRNIENLVKEIMRQPVEIVIGGRSAASNTVVQSVKVLEEHEKFNALLKLLGENYYKGQILIFTDRQEAVDSLFTELQKAGYYALTLHGGMNQDDRDSMIQDFKIKTRTILIATSVAARGLDVKDLNLVINYAVPNHFEDYVHRVGRTGRAGATGYAVTFITPSETRFAPELLKALKASKQPNIPRKLEEMAESFSAKVQAGHEKAAPTLRTSGSKGFKFDETEEYEQRAQRQRQLLVYGNSASRDKADVEEPPDDELKERSGPNESKLEPKLKEVKERREMTSIEKQLAAAKAGATAVRTTLNVTKSTTLPEEQAQALTRAAYRSVYAEAQSSSSTDARRSRLEAVARSIALSKKLAALGGSATPQALAEALSERQHTRRLEINDYPQQARFRVTSRAALESVKELADVNITVRGSFFAPGRRPGAGEERLALQVDGRTEADVERAYAELRRMVEEAAEGADERSGGYAKYSVV